MNGYNLIEEGHTIWGTIICLLTLAPIGIVGPIIAFTWPGWAGNKIRAIFLILLLYVPALPIGTVCYIIFVLVAGIMKVWNPNLSEVDDHIMFIFDGEDIVNYAAVFRIAEIVTESCPQSSLGTLHKL